MNKLIATLRQKTGQEKTNSKNFGFYLLLVTSFLVALTILITTFYSIRCMNLMMKDYTESISTYNNFITTSVIKAYSNARAKESYKELNDLVELLKKNYYVRYAYAYSPDTDRVLWASEGVYYGKTNKQIKEQYANKLINKGVLEENVLATAEYNFVVGLTKETVQDDIYRKMLTHLQIFVILFLIMGTIIAAYMSKQISKPLHRLVSGVKEFGRGNFKYRLSSSGFGEIDQLVGAYNRMASQLNDLYESLEAKVNERTMELAEANEKLKETQTMMVHSEKMRSLGELVAGIAHEINNPINFIYGNIMILDNYQKDLLALVEKYAEADSQIDSSKLNEINEFKKQIDIDFLKDDISDLIKSCIEGVERTKNIILDLKNFSRMEEMVFSECYIPKEIDTTLSILNNKIKNRITVHKDYQPGFPKIEAYGGQLNQVFMNIIDNAQGAIKDRGEIFITAKKLDDEYVSVTFEDTGCGISEENIHKIFEPFFTTKPVGQGTGLGMSIAYKVIEAHNGTISVESEVGKGTKIKLVLPIRHKENN